MALLKQLLPKKRKEAESLTGYELVEYLIQNPKAKGKFRFSSLRSNDLYELLSRRPEFIDRCYPAKITSSDASMLLVDQPRLLWWLFPLDKISWRDRLCARPELIEKMPKNRHLAQHSWMKILGCQPGLWDHSPKKFSNEEWAWIIGKQPQLADKCPWEDMVYPPCEIRRDGNNSEKNIARPENGSCAGAMCAGKGCGACGEKRGGDLVLYGFPV